MSLTFHPACSTPSTLSSRMGGAQPQSETVQRRPALPGPQGSVRTDCKKQNVERPLGGIRPVR